jgi:hypothetical protein
MGPSGNVWCFDEQRSVFQSGVVVSSDTRTTRVRFENAEGSAVEVEYSAPEAAGLLYARSDSDLSLVTDLVQLKELNEAEITGCIRRR